MPFLIEDITPRGLRVPGGRAAEHPNGATGISRLEIAASDTEEVAVSLAALTGAQDDAGTPLWLGACEISPVASARSAAGVPGPFAVELAGETPGDTQELDRDLAHGARIRLPRRSAGS